MRGKFENGSGSLKMVEQTSMTKNAQESKQQSMEWRHILSRQGQSQTNAIRAQGFDNSVLGPARCFAGGLYATRNNDQLRCLLRDSTEAPKSIEKQTARHAVRRCFAPPR
ncbi:hypothetical protein TNCV_1349901 [Trichonephila clavipes]|nr:hypothetical protein TNCV_1349901 [Trichonephila clavipes]